MPALTQRFSALFRSASPVPPAYRSVFFHLYMDIAWFGVLSGTTIAFLAVYATRMGATTEQIGLLSAVPAFVTLIFALPAGGWLSRRPMGRAVFWTSVMQRAFYLLLVPLPVMLLPKAQVWSIIGMTLLMNVPGAAMVVGFNSLFGTVVPVEWRGHVAGIRNAIVSVTATISTLIAGWLLDRMAFPTGYQVVFTIGLLGAAMSSVHLYLLSHSAGLHKASPALNGSAEARPANGSNGANGSGRLAAEIRGLYQRGLESLRLDVMTGHFRRIMVLLFGWHLFQFLTIPIITPFIVNQLHVSDQTIGLAGGLFNVTTFIGSLGLNRATIRYGNKILTGAGVMGLCLFPLLTAAGPVGYLLGNLAGGFFWSLVGGALYNYLLDHAPAHDRPAYLAWYSLVSNTAILIGSLASPLIAGEIGFVTALVIFGIGRFLAGAAILRWG